MKLGYAQHCKDNSDISTHVINFSLFNEKNKDFQPEYQNVQEDCYEIFSCANHFGTDDEQKGNVYDVHESISNIVLWMCHLIRDKKQDEAKKFAIKNLNENTGLRLSDWAQKVILVAYLEDQHVQFLFVIMSRFRDCVLCLCIVPMKVNFIIYFIFLVQ